MYDHRRATLWQRNYLGDGLPGGSVTGAATPLQPRTIATIAAQAGTTLAAARTAGFLGILMALRSSQETK